MDRCAKPTQTRRQAEEQVGQSIPTGGASHAAWGLESSCQFLAWKVLNPLAPAKEGGWYCCTVSSRALVLQEGAHHITSHRQTVVRPLSFPPTLILSSCYNKSPFRHLSPTTELLPQSTAKHLNRPPFQLLGTLSLLPRTQSLRPTHWF
jgi:hypothetical protein